MDENVVPKEIITSVVATSSQEGHTPEITPSQRYQRSAAPAVYELPAYTQADRSVKHELPGSDTEDMSISYSGPGSRWQSPVASPRSLYSNGLQYATPAVDLSDTLELLNPNPFHPASENGVAYPSQAHSVSTPISAGNNPMGPLSALPGLEYTGFPDPRLSSVMSPQHSVQGYVVSPRPSQDSWDMSTQVHGQSHYDFRS